MKNIIKSRRDFPAVELVASSDDLGKYSRLPHPLLVEVSREVINKLKKDFGKGAGELTHDALIKAIAKKLDLYLLKKIGKVINAAGILVHTNLGRAPLSNELFDTIKGQVTGYGNLEFDVASGKRGKRGELAEKYLAMVTGAEAGTIVNNNAAALFIILNTFANRRKVVISRGELVQIGGGFRIPDIIRRAGCKLIEIGTTNITEIKDYEKNAEENPALFLKVHRSNFDISGFTDEAEIRDLVSIGKKHSIPTINDLGSGVLIDTISFTGKREPSVQQSVRDGAELTCFSGDKLLGGIQAGLIVGQKEYIAKIKRNPIFRVVRVDKTIFSAVEEMLGYYLNDTWREKIKLWRLASRKEKDLVRLGQYIIDKSGIDKFVSLEKSFAEMGGGSLPSVKLKSMAIVFDTRHSPARLSKIFRLAEMPVIGRIYDNRFLLDLKAVDEEDADLLVKIIKPLKKSF